MGQKDRQMHKITESIGVIAGIYLIYLSQVITLSTLNYWFFLVFGLGNVLVDGYLLTTWGKAK